MVGWSIATVSSHKFQRQRAGMTFCNHEWLDKINRVTPKPQSHKLVCKRLPGLRHPRRIRRPSAMFSSAKPNQHPSVESSQTLGRENQSKKNRRQPTNWRSPSGELTGQEGKPNRSIEIFPIIATANLTHFRKLLPRLPADPRCSLHRKLNELTQEAAETRGEIAGQGGAFV